MKGGDDVRARLARIRRGGDEKYHAKAAEEGKLFCRERLALLLDPDSFVEDAVFANSLAPDLPADGVVIGSGRVAGRPVCVMANDDAVTESEQASSRLWAVGTGQTADGNLIVGMSIKSR